jgi:chloride channel protein, CIC family
MSSGHGALHFTSIVSMPLAMIATVFVLKALASVISLGSGFRGGFFFRHAVSRRARRSPVRGRH